MARTVSYFHKSGPWSLTSGMTAFYCEDHHVYEGMEEEMQCELGGELVVRGGRGVKGRRERCELGSRICARVVEEEV